MRRRTHLAVLVLAALAAACGDSGGPDPGPLPNDGTDAVGLTIRDEVEASLDARTVPTQRAPYGGEADQRCADPSDPEDTDGDGVPTSAEYIITAPPCRFEDIRNTTLDMVGRLQIADPDPGAGGAGFEYNGALVNLRSSFRGEDADHSYSITRNGTRVLTGSTAGLELATDLQLLRTFPGLSDAAVDVQWTVSFDPDTPLQINHALPAGALAVAVGVLGVGGVGAKLVRLHAVGGELGGHGQRIQRRLDLVPDRQPDGIRAVIGEWTRVRAARVAAGGGQGGQNEDSEMGSAAHGRLRREFPEHSGVRRRVPPGRWPAQE